MGSTRHSLWFIDHKPVKCNTLELPIIHKDYDFKSRKFWRYIIEDMMYINPIGNVLLLLCKDSIEFKNWMKIITE